MDDNLVKLILFKSDIKTIVKILALNKYWYNQADNIYTNLCMMDFNTASFEKFNIKSYKQLYQLFYVLKKLKVNIKSNITKLDISNNIPKELAYLPKLNYINLINPGTIPEYFYNKIISLNISNSNLNNIPDEIGNLTRLDIFNISNNKIRQLPECIFNLTSLTKLYVNNNKLTELPASVKKLTELNVLYISCNNINKLPDEITQLTKLIELSIEKTDISALPHIDNLQVLVINNENVVKIPKSLKQKNNLYIFKTALIH